MVVRCEKCGTVLEDTTFEESWIGGYCCDDEEACAKRQAELKEKANAREKE
jgi:hypothetical protein